MPVWFKNLWAKRKNSYFITYSNSWYCGTGMDGLPQMLDNAKGCLQT
jgi:hypothetical protein